MSYEIARKSFSIDRHAPPLAGGIMVRCPSIFPIDGLHNASALTRADSEQSRCHVPVNTGECRIGGAVDAMENLSSPRHPPLASLDLMPSVRVSRAERTTWSFRWFGIMFYHRENDYTESSFWGTHRDHTLRSFLAPRHSRKVIINRTRESVLNTIANF